MAGCQPDPNTHPPPITERPINTSIITQTLRNTVLSSSPGPIKKLRCKQRHSGVGQLSCLLYFESASLSLSLCCTFYRVGRLDILTHNNVANDVLMCKTNNADWQLIVCLIKGKLRNSWKDVKRLMCPSDKQSAVNFDPWQILRCCQSVLHWR